MAMFNKISKDADYEDPRREFLVRALTAGAFITTGALGLLKPAQAAIWGKRPYKMPSNKSIFNMKGAVWVNDKKADYDTFIKPSDRVRTGDGSDVVFVVGTDAFILRENSQLQLDGDGILINTMRLVTGKILSVFGKREAHQQKHIMRTSTATIGIRGTGVYAESEEGQSYFCTCYGVTDIMATEDSNSRTQVAASHHDAPKYILADGAAGKRIVPAPMINHTDLELILVEELVGRKPPFGIESTEYKAPRRSY